MGLDSVELLLKVEETFSIQIPDSEAVQLLTPGDLYAFVLANTKATPDPPTCLSAIAFYSLRRAARALGVAQRLRPSDSTLNLLPPRGRRHFWSCLQCSADLLMPPLQRASWVVRSSTAIALLGGACLAYALHTMTSLGVAVCAGVAATVMSGFVLARLTRPFAIHPSRHCGTLRGLVEAVLALNFQRLTEQYDGARAKDVWMALRAIIVEQLGVAPEAVTPAARFVQDLGLQ